MKKTVLSLMLALCLLLSSSIALATTFTDAHGNEIELDDSLEAYTTVVLSGADNAARKEETNLGDLCADAYRAVSGADIALVNGGGIRADIPAGDITYGQIIKVHPYGNALCVVEATGQEIIDALEWTARNTMSTYSDGENSVGEMGGFLQVSGLKYTIDTTVKSSAKGDDKSMFVSVDGAYRVKNVKVLKNGKAKKITVFTYKPKKDEKRKMGHRQPYTKVEITSIKA